MLSYPPTLLLVWPLVFAQQERVVRARRGDFEDGPLIDVEAEFGGTVDDKSSRRFRERRCGHRVTENVVRPCDRRGGRQRQTV